MNSLSSISTATCAIKNESGSLSEPRDRSRDVPRGSVNYRLIYSRFIKTQIESLDRPCYGNFVERHSSRRTRYHLDTWRFTTRICTNRVYGNEWIVKLFDADSLFLSFARETRRNVQRLANLPEMLTTLARRM